MTLHYHTEKQKKKLRSAAKAGVKDSRSAWMKRAGRRAPTPPELERIERQRVEAHMRSKRVSGKKPVKPKPKPKGIFDRIFGGLNEALTQGKKKKEQ